MAMDIREQVNETIQQTQGWIDWSKGRILNLLGVSRTQQSVFHQPKPAGLSSENRKSHQITPPEIDAIMDYCNTHRGVNYYKLAYQMMDERIAFVPPSTVYSILRAQGFYDVQAPKSTAAKAYADKPTHVHHTWHVDIAYVKIQEIYYYLIVMIDGYSRYVLDWELLFDMKGDTVSLFAQKVLDQYPEAIEKKVRIVSDNGSCFVSSEYRLVLKQNSIIPIRCAPYHPETNGKAEAVIKIARNEALRPHSPQFYQEAITVLKKHFDFYNNNRLHSGIKYVRPVDMFLGRADQVLQQRKEGLHQAKLERKTWNQNHNETKIYKQTLQIMNHTFVRFNLG